MLAAANVFLAGTPGGRPFAGHFRGALAWGSGASRVVLGWAGRLGPEKKPMLDAPLPLWNRTEHIRGRLLGLPQLSSRTEALQAAWMVLHGERSVVGEDLCVLFLAIDKDGPLLSGCGLSQLFVPEQDTLRPLLASTHPFFGPPGLPDAPGLHVPDQGEQFYAVPAGTRLVGGNIDKLFGIRG